MKLDIKSILILVLLGISITFFFIWYFDGPDNYKKELNKLREENKRLEAKRDSINQHIKIYEEEFKKLKNQDSLLKYKILETEKDVEMAKNKAQSSKEELDKMRSELDKTKKQIEEMKSHPANREGDDLLNSLKSKSKK